MWKSKKVDLIPAFATFVCCLIWALEYGILVGVGIQVLFILYNAARPSVVVQVHTRLRRPQNNIQNILISSTTPLIC